MILVTCHASRHIFVRRDIRDGDLVASGGYRDWIDSHYGAASA